METGRRAFLHLAGSIVAALLRVRPARARGSTAPPEIHTTTSNFLLGPRGTRRRTEHERFWTHVGLPREELPALVEPSGLPLLEAVRSYAPARGFTDAPLSRAELARLLYFCNGATGRVSDGMTRFDLRAAPSAGALYAGEVYVVVDRVTGLTPGIYAYSVPEHALVRLRAGAFTHDVHAAVERPGALRGAAVYVLLSNVFGRYTSRYANRGYRYALIDTGHIGENLRLAATSAGLSEATEWRFHDTALDRLLQIDGREEAVCAVHALGRGAVDSPTSSSERRRLIEVQYVRGEAPLDGGDLLTRYHAATRLVPGAEQHAAKTQHEGTKFELAVPASDAALRSRTSVETSIRKRRSPDRFVERPIERGELEFVAALARGTGALRRTSGVDLHVVVHRVRDLEPGLYGFNAGGRLERVRSGNLRDSLVRACRGQKNAGRAAAGFAVSGRLDARTSALGDRGYRDLLLDAGAIGQRVYLAAEAQGLAARNLAAFTDKNLNDLLGLDGRRRAVLHLTMLGVAS